MKNNLESHIEKNKNILIYVDGKLMSRDEAKVSVYDSGFMMGDGVWEGIRLYNNKWLFLDEHIHRLYEGAKAIDLNISLTMHFLILKKLIK
jgi:branched-chain amino acid aminotransferase